MSLLVFLPWLRLQREHCVAGVEFRPFRDEGGKATPPMRGAVTALTKILSSYRDRRGRRIDNCVCVTLPDRGWNLSEDDFDAIRWATSLLFLSAWACNEYFPRFAGRYVNSETFRFVGQKYSRPRPRYIGLVSRRRDGSTWDGGYQHGEAKFSIPAQCSIRDSAALDEGFLAALDAAAAADARTARALKLSLPFVMLSNADDEAMSLNAEAILMASAFEQLISCPSKSFELGRKIGAMLHSFGSKTVAEAKQARPGIEIDTSKPEYAAAQPRWWVHRKWMEELYDVRSKAAHRGHHQQREWGWSLSEHLLMAAFVFPLTVKLLLQHDGYYALTEDDEARCLAVDALLAATRWDAGEDDEENDGEERPAGWATILTDVRTRLRWHRIHARIFAEHPSLLGGDGTDEGPTSTS